jgi:hypothetical protein
MTTSAIAPRLIPRTCGGWLAVSGRGDSLQIGVTAPSEAKAREKFLLASETLRGWLAADRAPRLGM